MLSQSRSIEKFPVDPIPTFVPTWFNRAIDKTLIQFPLLQMAESIDAPFFNQEWVNAATRSRALGAYCWVDKSEKSASYHAICLPTSGQRQPLIALNSRLRDDALSGHFKSVEGSERKAVESDAFNYGFRSRKFTRQLINSITHKLLLGLVALKNRNLSHTRRHNRWDIFE